MLRSILTVATLVATSFSANAAEIWLDVVNKELVVDMTKFALVEDDQLEMNRLIVTFPGKFTGVRVTGVGGDFETAILFSQAIQDLDLDTYAVGECYSACAYMWLAGTLGNTNEAMVEDNADVQNHIPNSLGYVTPTSMALLGYYAGTLNMDRRFADHVLSKANYYDNIPFDFIGFLDEQHYDDLRIKIVDREVATSIGTARPGDQGNPVVVERKGP